MTVTWSWNRNEPNAARRLWQHRWSQMRARNNLARMTTRFDIAPEKLAQIAMREVASDLGILSLFGPAFGRAFTGPFDRNVSAAAAVPWYLAGGAPTPIAVYEPKGAASLAASYVNLVNPGTYDAALGTAPTFGAATGWTFNGSQYLKIASVNAGYSVIVRFSGAVASGAYTVCGANLAGHTAFFHPNRTTVVRYAFGAGSTFDVTPALVAGTLAMCGDSGYRNGIADVSGMNPPNVSVSAQWYVGARNENGSPAQYFTGSVQALAIWNTSTNHATWMPAVSAAAALI